MASRWTIGQLSLATGCKITTIRYFEKTGLLPEVERSAGNTRIYGPAHVARLTFVQHCRELGFDQQAIKELLDLSDRPEQACDDVIDIAQRHLNEVKSRICQLQALEAELETMIGSCGGGPVGQCRIIEAIAGHRMDDAGGRG